MGFRTGAYAKVWKVEPATNTRTKLQISISRKNKETGEYTQDFSGFVNVIGTAGAQKAALLPEGARIKLGDCDVTTNYVKEKNITYTNYALFNFEDADSAPLQSSQTDGGYTTPSASGYSIPSANVDDGEAGNGEVDDSGDKLPF